MLRRNILGTQNLCLDCERGGMEQSDHKVYPNIETSATGSDGIQRLQNEKRASLDRCRDSLAVFGGKGVKHKLHIYIGAKGLRL